MTSLPGFGGHLVVQSFLDARTPRQREAPAASQAAALRAATIALRNLGPASAPRALLETFVRPLVAWLGFEACDAVRPCGPALAATARAIGRPVSLIVTPWGEGLEGHWRSAVTEARRCDASWALLVNGVQLRVVHAGRLYSRRFASFDLPLALEQPEVLAVFRDLVSAPAVCGDPSHPASLHAIVSASDRYAAGVCRSLRVGVLSAASEVLGALIAGAPGDRGPRSEVNEIFEQALTIVYRILFLLFAEARALVPLWHPVYRDSYSIESLRDAVERESSRTPGLWDALRAISRLAHAGCRAGDLRVTPFNGRLFAPARTPLAERRNLDAGAARRAVLALSTRPSADRAGRERIVYRDLGVEQLGAVYETLLDYRPHVTRSRSDATGGRGPRSEQIATVTLERGGGVRKATGAFYTPQPIAEYVVQHTLAPLVRDAAPDEILGLRVLDPAMGSGAFLVAACRYLASAYEHAVVTIGGRRADDIDDAERATIRRLVAERCLYGVDLNPMAVQLARLSLWLATLSADRPLSFLDHRLVVGDSLIGTWLTHLRRPPVRQRGARLRTLPLFPEDVATTALKDALPVRFSLEQMPNDTLDQVRAKERALEALAAGDTGISKWKRLANLWCAGWFGVPDKPGTSGKSSGKAGAPVPAGAFHALADGLLSASPTLPARTAAAYLEQADAVSRAHRFFHWELEFPEVFFDGDGRQLARPGFDAVIGNPPWDMLRVDRGSDQTDEAAADTIASTVRFTRDSGVYRAQSGGHANRYQLFFERVIDLTRPGGRFGLVLPSGLATDPGSAALRRELLARCDVDSLVGVDNRRGIFPIHRGLRFLLVSATAGSPTRLVTCRLGIESAADLETVPGGQPSIQLSPDTISRISGLSLAIPYLRSAVDLAICEKAAALFPPLGSDRGWAAHFGRELNATEDRGMFLASRRGLPVIDGRHIGPFHVSIGRSTRSILAADARRILGRDRIRRPRLAYRDVASATNRLTLIAAVLPSGCVSTHTLFCLRTAVSAPDQRLLCGLFNSLVVNYLVRLRVTMHVTAAIVEQLPIPTREASPRLCREIEALAARLARAAVSEGREDTEDRVITPALAVLNARVAELYRLTRAELEHILATFPLVAREVRDQTLAAFEP